jgi:hypothetical protein
MDLRRSTRILLPEKLCECDNAEYMPHCQASGTGPREPETRHDSLLPHTSQNRRTGYAFCPSNVGTQPAYSRRDNVLVLIGSYLLLVFLLPLVLSAIVGYSALPRGHGCPECGGDTIHLRNRTVRALSRLTPRSVLQRRWCLCCGWEGLTRLPRRHRLPAAPRMGAARGGASRDGAPRDGAPRDGTSSDGAPRDGTPHDAVPAQSCTQTLNVRSLQVDGTAWQVMLQCWSSTGLIYGRLVFVSPTGRLWLDAVQSFNGANESEVLGQVRLLPEPLLALRLRRLASRRGA